jgi:hypothetical protein
MVSSQKGQDDGIERPNIYRPAGFSPRPLVWVLRTFSLREGLPEILLRRRIAMMSRSFGVPMKDLRHRTKALRTPLTVVGVFDDGLLADQAVSELCRAGFAADQIGVFLQIHTGPADKEAVAIFPSKRPFVAAGTVEASRSTVEADTSVLGLVGALINAGMPEREAHYYRDECEAGRTLVTVAAGRRSGVARSILRRNGSYDMLSGIVACDFLGRGEAFH